MRPILAVKGTGTGTVGMYLLTPYGATSYGFLGGTIGTSFFNSETWPSPHAVQFGSKIYHRYYISLYEYDTISGNNAVFRQASDASANSGSAEWYGGVYITNIGGDWYLVYFYPTNAGSLKAERYHFASNTWLTSSNIHAAGDADFALPRFQYGSDIYWHLGNSSNMTAAPTTYKYSISGNTASSFSGPANTYGNTISMVSYLGGLYALGHGTAGLQLFQLIGGLWQLISTINATGPSTTHSPTQMFTDGTYLYCIAYYATSGWRMWQLTSGLVATEITSSVFPTYLRSNTGLNYQASFRGIHVDSHTDPSNPEIWLTYSAGSKTLGAGLSWFRWMGPSSVMNYVGDAGEGGQDYNISYSQDGGGQYIYSAGEPNIQVEGEVEAAATAGNVAVPFKVYESLNVPSGSLVDVNLFYSTSPHPPRSRGRITNVTPSGEQIDDYTVRVAATSGTLWGLEWRSAADGVAVGERVSCTLYVSKADV